MKKNSDEFLDESADSFLDEKTADEFLDENELEVILPSEKATPILSEFVKPIPKTLTEVEILEIIKQEIKKIPVLPTSKVTERIIEKETIKEVKDESKVKELEKELKKLKEKISEELDKVRDEFPRIPVIRSPIPKQSGHAGEVLTTDGHKLKWAAASGGSDASGGSIVFGDGTDGSWRIIIDGNNFAVQRLESGNWTEKGVFLQ